MIFFPALDLPRSAPLVPKRLPQRGAILGHVLCVEFSCDTSSEPA